MREQKIQHPISRSQLKRKRNIYVCIQFKVYTKSWKKGLRCFICQYQTSQTLILKVKTIC